VFGMGFATDKAGGTSERLYITPNNDSHTLWSIDTEHDLRPRSVGSLAVTDGTSPELTGTGEGKLFGFFPTESVPALVQELDPKTAAPIGKAWPLGSTPLDIHAYAFAQWGGTFYIFATTGSDENSTIRTIDRATGAYRVLREHLPYRITGAGVSTCAPEHDGVH
jgi:hypothetical protein